jgi:hypothetical protein
VAWKLCRGKTLSEVEELLLKDDFGELLNTLDIIMRLGKESIGTADKTLIDNVISPSSRQYFEIRIYWPKDNDPKGIDSIKIQRQASVESVLVKY